MTVHEGFGEVTDMLATMSPEKIVALKAPLRMSERVEFLISRKKEGLLSFEESAELERFLALDSFISLAKARAYVLLAA